MKGNGIPGASKYDEMEATLNLLNAAINADKTTTVGNIRCHVEELNAVRFNRDSVNQELHSKLIESPLI